MKRYRSRPCILLNAINKEKFEQDLDILMDDECVAVCGLDVGEFES